METLEQRELRLLAMAGAIEDRLEEEWMYVLVLGKPNNGKSVNMVTNAPLEAQGEILEMLRELVRRREAGVKPKELI